MSDTIKSTDDARVESGPVRHAYRTLSEAEKQRVEAVKDHGQAFLDEIAVEKLRRELSLARTRIEEAVMRAVSEAEKQRVEAVKDHGQAFLDTIAAEQGREVSLARTRIEEAVMWAVKGLTR